jgi:hypothetical protein
VSTPDALVAAARAFRGPGPLPIAGPRGALETLGPGWPRILAEGFADAWATAEPDRAPPAIALTCDGGAAVGLALAAVADWPAPSGWTLTLVLDAAEVPAAAVEDIRTRAAGRGVMVAAAA